jgi:hypothetical protein
MTLHNERRAYQGYRTHGGMPLQTWQQARALGITP